VHNGLKEVQRSAVHCTAKGPSVLVGPGRRKAVVDQVVEAHMHLRQRRKALVVVQSSETGLRAGRLPVKAQPNLLEVVEEVRSSSEQNMVAVLLEAGDR